MTKPASTPILAAISTLTVIVACAMVIGSGLSAQAAPYVVTLEQVGNDVVADGSGAIDLTDLNPRGITPTTFIPRMNAALLQMAPVTGGQPTILGGFIFTGQGSTFQGYSIFPPGPNEGIPGPAVFGSGTVLTATPTSSIGDPVGIGLAFNLVSRTWFRYLAVPPGYVSDSPLSSISTYANKTITGPDTGFSVQASA